MTLSSTTAYIGDEVIFTATLDGEDVTSTATFYVDEEAITGNTFTSNVEGSFLVHASYPNAQNSLYATLNIVANPFEDITGTGNFIYNGTTYEVDGGYLTLDGFYSDGNGGATAWWIQYAWSGNDPNTAENFVAISFDTPATLVGQQVTDYVLPDANQNAYYSIEALRTNGQNQLTTQYLEGSGELTYNSLQAETAPAIADLNFEVTSPLHNVTLIYNGMVTPPETGGRPAARVANTTQMQLKSQKQLKEGKLALTKRFFKQ